MTRTLLPNRRESIVVSVLIPMGVVVADSGEHHGERIAADMHYGWDERRIIREVFCLPLKVGTDLQSTIHHLCIGLSVGLQHGATMWEMARAMGAGYRRPQSMPEIIARQGAEIDACVVVGNIAAALTWPKMRGAA